MRKFIQQKLKDQKGLTLIELLAVIVILAIIAAIAIPAIAGIIENSRVGAAKSDALSYINAAELYLIDNPDAFDAVGTVAGTITGEELKTEGYMDDLGLFTTTTSGATTSNVIITKETEAGEGLEFSGTAEAGDITITITTQTQAEISGTPNGERTTDTTLVIN